MTEFKYLGYTFKYNNKDDAHIQDIRKRATAAMVQIWSIGERKFGGDFRRRVIMLNKMVKSRCMNAEEVWCIEQRKKICPLRGHILIARFARSSLRSQA